MRCCCVCHYAEGNSADSSKLWDETGDLGIIMGGLFCDSLEGISILSCVDNLQNIGPHKMITKFGDNSQQCPFYLLIYIFIYLLSFRLIQTNREWNKTTHIP